MLPLLYPFSKDPDSVGGGAQIIKRLKWQTALGAVYW
jgi:hypothetical protein